MPFTFYNPPALSPEQTNPLAGMFGNLIPGYEKGIRAKYLPQMQQAEIFGKEFAPLAQIASSPLASAMLPEQRQQMMGFISNLLSQMNPGSNGNMQGGNGGMLGKVGGAISNFIHGNNSANVSGGNGTYNGGASGYGGGGNVVGNSPAQGQRETGAGTGYDVATPEQVQQIADNAARSIGQEGFGNLTGSTSNFPQLGGGLQKGVLEQTLAKYKEAVHPPGTNYIDEKTGDLKTTATPTILTDDQVGMGAIQMAIPMIDKLKEDAKKVMVNNRYFKLGASIIDSALESGLGINSEWLKKNGITPQFYSDYLQFKKDQTDLMEYIHTAKKYQGTQQGSEHANELISPGTFQDLNGYLSILDNEKQKLKAQNETFKSHQAGGFQSTPGKPIESPTIKTVKSNIPPVNAKTEGTKVLKVTEQDKAKGITARARDNGQDYFYKNGNWYYG